MTIFSKIAFKFEANCEETGLWYKEKVHAKSRVMCKGQVVKCVIHYIVKFT